MFSADLRFAKSLMLVATLTSVGMFIGADSGEGDSPRELPLHLRVPAQDAPPEEMLRWILCPGNGPEINVALLQGYLKLLPAEAFPAAFEALTRLQLRQQGVHMTLLIEAWAEKDPEAAWKVVEPWFAHAFTEDHFIDEWSEKLVPPHQPTSLTPGAVVPEDCHFNAFEAGLTKSKVSAEVKASLLTAFDKDMARYFPDLAAPSPRPPTPPVTPPLPPSAEPQPPAEPEVEVDFAFLREVLEAPLSALPSLLEAAVRRHNDPAVICGLRRWVMLAPTSVPEILAWTEKQASNQQGDVLETWTALMPAKAYAWLTAKEPDILVDFAADVVAHLPDDLREDLLQRVQSQRPSDEPYNDSLPDILAKWAATDPSRALDTALKLGGSDLYGQTAEQAFYDMPQLSEFRQPLISAIQAIPVPVEDDYAYTMMEEWGDIDVAEAARYGVDWLLQDTTRGTEALRPMQHLIDVWTGKEDPDDSSMDDRTYGCLRMWALVDPEGMKAWVATQEDPRVRQALEWLQKHAVGGFRQPPKN